KKTNANYIDYLATDHPMICRAVMEQGCVESLALLVKSITPDEVVEGGEAGEEGMSIWEDESLGVVELREQPYPSSTSLNPALIALAPTRLPRQYLH
ncbi:hypothetical protein BDQ17DRAFT_1367336, partial [Cyathus striatus]